MFKAEFSTDNAAFDELPATESARILRVIARQIETGERLGGGPIFDVNGDRVGWWELTPYRDRT